MIAQVFVPRGGRRTTIAAMAGVDEQGPVKREKRGCGARRAVGVAVAADQRLGACAHNAVCQGVD